MTVQQGTKDCPSVQVPQMTQHQIQPTAVVDRPQDDLLHTVAVRHASVIETP